MSDGWKEGGENVVWLEGWAAGVGKKEVVEGRILDVRTPFFLSFSLG